MKERIPSIESFQGEDIPVFLLDDLPADQALFLVHSVSKSDLDRDVRNKKVTSNRICMSILDDRHSKTFLDGIVFGFCNMAVPLYSATSFDGQTGQWYYNDSRPVYRSTLTSVDDFMEHTFSEYNELCYFTNGQYQTPSYVLVINREPSDSDYQVASSLHIPIVIYHTKDKDHETVTSENNDDDFLSEWFDYMKKTFPLLPANPEKKEIEVLL